MNRHRSAVLVLAILLGLGVASAAPISSSTCTTSDTTGCITTYMPNSPAVAVQVSGTWVGTIEFQGSNDNIHFTALRGYPVAGGAYVTSITSEGAWTVVTGGLKYVRFRGSSWASGSADVVQSVTISDVSIDVVRAVGDSFGAVGVSLNGELVAAEVTGPAGDPVAVSGTVGLNAATLASIAGPTCLPSDVRRIAITATPTVIPVIASTRTEVTIRNRSVGAISISCRPDVSGTGDLPDCSTPGYGFTISPSESVTFSYRDSITIRCRTCPAGNGIVEHLEVSCVG